MSFTGVKVLGVAGLGLATASCNLEQHERMIAYGVGTNLYTPETAQATAELETYLGYLCQQAGLNAYVTNGSSETSPSCYTDVMGGPEWTLLVATGMNDIDRRCDGYLAWLDNQRRTNKAVNLEFGHLRTLTTGVLGAADVASATIAIVGVALGFAQDSYNAYQNRLLLDIEGSTIETIVIERRLKFREEFAGVPIYVRPDAVRVMQDYLRICTPYAIRMSINTYSRARASGAPTIEDREAKALKNSLLSTRIRDVNAPLRVPARPAPVQPAPSPAPVEKTTYTPKTTPKPTPKPTPPPVIPVRLGVYEQTLSTRDIMAFQRAVCVPATGELGPIGSPTRLAIKRILGADDEVLTDRKGVLLRRRLDDKGTLKEGVSCTVSETVEKTEDAGGAEKTNGTEPAETRLNSFERSLSANDIVLLQTAACVAPTGDLGPLGSPTRLAIKQVLGADDELVTDRDAIVLRRRLDDTGNLLEGVNCP